MAIAHDTVEQYVGRLTNRVNESLSQIPDGEDGWIAFHWTNGAPLWLLREVAERAELPESIRGLMLVGSVVGLDGILHDFWFELPKHVACDNTALVDDHMPPSCHIVEAVDRSASVRPTVLRVPTGDGLRELIVRDGSRRFWPFILLLAEDPAGFLPPRRLRLSREPFTPMETPWRNQRAVMHRRFRYRPLE